MNPPPDNNEDPSGAAPARRKRRQPATGETPAPTPIVAGGNTSGNVRATGSARVRIVQTQNTYTQLSQNDEKRLIQQSELQYLENAIQQKYADLSAAVDAPPPEAGNPYLFTRPFEFGDNKRFFGRADEIQEIIDHLQSSHLTFLDGYGKTSTLRAGLVPALIRAGHLPVLVTVTSEPLDLTIKKQILPGVESREFLMSMPLAEFLRRIADKLAQGKRLYILVDHFEAFYNQLDKVQEDFRQKWEFCATEFALNVHWLFAVPAGSTNLLKIFRDRAQLNADLITLQQLGPEQARDVILRTAQFANIQIDPAVTQSILDTLAKPDVDPAQLQVVCSMLAKGPGKPVVQNWTMEYYQSQGGAGGILSNYLERTINSFDQSRREPAWQLLAALVEQGSLSLSEDALLQKTRELNIDDGMARQTLQDLVDNHLVDPVNAYHLSSDSLRPRLKQYLDSRSARSKAHTQMLEQVRAIRASALRGLLGGIAGFGLAYLCLPYPARPTSWDASVGYYLYLLSNRALLGGIAGFLLVLSVDFIAAAYQGRQQKLRFPLSALAGGLAFAWLLSAHVFLGYFGDDIWLATARAASVGALWGVVCGLVVMLAVLPNKLGWGVVPLAGLAGGAALFISEWFLQGLNLAPEQAASPAIFLAGAVMPMLLIVFTQLGKAPSTPGGAP